MRLKRIGARELPQTVAGKQNTGSEDRNLVFIAYSCC